MFWFWFFAVAILSSSREGKTILSRLRKTASFEALKLLVWIGAGSFVLFGIAGIGRGTSSWFFQLLVACVSWLGFSCIPELVSQNAKRNDKNYYRDIEQEVSESKKNLPRVRTPDQYFMSKTNFEFPLAPPPPTIEPPKEKLVDILAGSVERSKTSYTYVESMPMKAFLMEKEQNKIRSELLGVLTAFSEANSPHGAEPEMVDVLAPAPPVPSLFSTPILETGTTDGSLGVTSRFGTTPAKTLAEPLLSADLASASREGDVESSGGFSYKPKLVESKFSKPIE